ncbi:MAG: SNF2-related protein, partial [Phycisphaerae bacterium]
MVGPVHQEREPPPTENAAGLRALCLKPEYRSDRDALVEDFYVPCLKRSRLYRRAVGFFTSHGLAVAAEGITSLIEGGGRMLLIASPVFEPEDLDAIRRGYEARDRIVSRALSRQLDVSDRPDLSDRLGYLAWLIAEERLDIRIAVPTDANGGPRAGIYHEKLGLFSDHEDHVVAFTGSPNETAGGLVANFETLDVFWSWDDPQEWVARKVANFGCLWQNRVIGFNVVAFPDAARRHLLKFRPASSAAPENEAVPQSPPQTLDPTDLPFSLRAYQSEGVAFLAQSESALLADEMGLGKTVQAILAIRVLRKMNQCQRALIVAPRSLCTNWRREFGVWAPNILVRIVEGNAQNRQALYHLPIPVLISTYE